MKEMTKNGNFLGIDKQYSTYNDSDVVILSAPFEKTVSYGKGTKNGPKEILKASHYVEFYDEELDNEFCFEKGICTLEPLKLDDLTPAKALGTIQKSVTKLLEDNKFVVTLGGEHSISSASIKAHHEKYPDFTILHIDAHSDLRDKYEGSKYSHASVMARVAEFTTNIVQVGIRAQCIEEAEFIREKQIETFYMRDIRSGKYGRFWHWRILSKLGKNVYVTFDVDGFDPSVIAATGTPEPGGLLWDETMNLLKLVGKRRNIIGFDVVELAPAKDEPSSNFTAAKLVYKMLNYAFQHK